MARLRIDNLGMDRGEGRTSFDVDLRTGDWIFVGSEQGAKPRVFQRAGELSYVMDANDTKRIVVPGMELCAGQFRVYEDHVKYANMQSEMTIGSMPQFNRYRGRPHFNEPKDLFLGRFFKGLRVPNNHKSTYRMQQFNAQSSLLFFPGECIDYDNTARITYFKK